MFAVAQRYILSPSPSTNEGFIGSYHTQLIVIGYTVEDIINLINMEAQKVTGFLKNAYYQGHGRYVNQIVRMTLKFCKSHNSSVEMRKFIETNLVDVARANPGCVIYVKPRLFKIPVLTADYLNGQNHYLNLKGMSCIQIGAWIDWHITRSGYDLNKLARNITTYHPTVQGVWTPFVNKDPKLTTMTLPDEELSKFRPEYPSATDQLIQIAKQYGFKEPEPFTEDMLTEECK